MKRLARALLHIPVPWVFVLTYLIGVGVELLLRPHGSLRAVEVLPGTGIVGVALFVIGAVGAGWGLVTFHRARTTTVPGQLSSQLVMWGPYRFTRNPMYVGLTLAYLGEAGILHQIWPVFLLPFTIAYVHWIVIPLEESRLLEAFGAEYQQYQSGVRRWL